MYQRYRLMDSKFKQTFCPLIRLRSFQRNNLQFTQPKFAQITPHDFNALHFYAALRKQQELFLSCF